MNLLDLRNKLAITIFGSYDRKAVTRLNNLKECLIRAGYSKCRIVSDYVHPPKKKKETYDQYFLRKSIYWLELSDSCFFVFFADVENDGVAFELQRTCEHLLTKLETSLVLVDLKRSRYSTSLIRGTVTNLVALQKLNRRFFKDDAQLCKFCASAALSFLRKRKFFLMDRNQ